MRSRPPGRWGMRKNASLSPRLIDPAPPTPTGSAPRIRARAPSRPPRPPLARAASSSPGSDSINRFLDSLVFRWKAVTADCSFFASR